MSSAMALDNKSRGFQRIDFLGSLKSMYLCSGWGEKARMSLQAAITQVFDQNSIFTGKHVDGERWLLLCASRILPE